jgi:hypothetical protein
VYLSKILQYENWNTTILVGYIHYEYIYRPCFETRTNKPCFLLPCFIWRCYFSIQAKQNWSESCYSHSYPILCLTSVLAKKLIPLLVLNIHNTTHKMPSLCLIPHHINVVHIIMSCFSYDLLSRHVRSCLPGFPDKMLYAFLISRRSPHVTLVVLIILIIFDDGYKLWALRYAVLFSVLLLPLSQVQILIYACCS